MNGNESKESNANILVVDDSSENLDILTRVLQTRNYKVCPATSADIALSKIKEEQPDLILLDIKMPGVTGYEVCEQLKRNKKTCDIPIIFVSALSEIDDKIKGFALGGIDYIIKPFDPEELLARVSAHLQLKKDNAKKHESKNLFLNKTSLEIEESLTLINKYSEYLRQEQALEGRQMNAVNKICSSSEHLLAIAKGIADITEIESGKIEIQPVEFNLLEFLKDIVTQVRYRAYMKEFLFEYFLGKELPEIVYGDKIRILQIVSNIFYIALNSAPQNAKITFSADADKQQILKPESIFDICFEIQVAGIDGNKIKTEKNAIIITLVKDMLKFMKKELHIENSEAGKKIFRFNLEFVKVVEDKVSQEESYSAEGKNNAEPESINSQSQNIIFPPQNELLLLIQGAQCGNYSLIKRQINRLKSNGSDYHSFACEIENRLNTFEFKEIYDFISSHLRY